MIVAVIFMLSLAFTVLFWKIVGLLGVVIASCVMGIFDRRFIVLAVFAFMAQIWCALFLI